MDVNPYRSNFIDLPSSTIQERSSDVKNAFCWIAFSVVINVLTIAAVSAFTAAL
jgi:hypothetical protein